MNGRSAKADDAFRTISEVATTLGVPQHVLRFWETRFPQLRPIKRGGNRRYYRPEDVALARALNRLLYSDGYTVKGVQKLLKERGVRAVIADATGEVVADEPADAAAPHPAGTSDMLSDLRAIRDRLAAALAA